MDPQSIERYQTSREPVREEKIYLSDGDVLVTNRRFVVRVTTYPMEDVVDVATEKMASNRSAAVIVFALGIGGGIVGTIVHGAYGALGLIPCVIGLFLFRGLRDNHGVIVETTMGKETVLWSKDRARVTRITDALRKAVAENLRDGRVPSSLRGRALSRVADDLPT